MLIKGRRDFRRPLKIEGNMKKDNSNLAFRLIELDQLVDFDEHDSECSIVPIK